MYDDYTISYRPVDNKVGVQIIPIPNKFRIIILILYPTKNDYGLMLPKRNKVSDEVTAFYTSSIIPIVNDKSS